MPLISILKAELLLMGITDKHHRITLEAVSVSFITIRDTRLFVRKHSKGCMASGVFSGQRRKLQLYKNVSSLFQNGQECQNMVIKEASSPI